MALALVVLTFVCAVSPVAINMAGLRLRAQAVKVDAEAQALKAEVRDLEARIASLSSAPVLQKQVEKMGMVSAQSVSYLVAEDGNADGGIGPQTAAVDGDSGVAWVAADTQAAVESAATANAQ